MFPDDFPALTSKDALEAFIDQALRDGTVPDDERAVWEAWLTLLREAREARDEDFAKAVEEGRAAVLTAHPLRAVLPISEHLLGDPTAVLAYDVDRKLTQEVSEVLALRSTRSHLCGTGIEGDTLGVTNTAAISIWTPQGATAETILECAYQIRGRINAPHARLTAFFSPDVLTWLDVQPNSHLWLHVDADGARGHLAGMPFFVTTQLPKAKSWQAVSAERVVLGDVSRAKLGASPRIKLKVSDQNDTFSVWPGMAPPDDHAFAAFKVLTGFVVTDPRGWGMLQLPLGVPAALR
jgi:hypothetical protein